MATSCIPVRALKSACRLRDKPTSEPTNGYGAKLLFPFSDRIAVFNRFPQPVLRCHHSRANPPSRKFAWRRMGDYVAHIA